MAAIFLKPGRERSLLRRHPWIFSGAIQYEDKVTPGDTVDVFSAKRQLLARAAYSPLSQIRARVWSFGDETIDREFLRGRIRSAVRARQVWLAEADTDSYRLINAEADGLPGLIVDRFADTLVLQLLTAGAEFWRQTIIELLLSETGLDHIFERSDADVRELEGLPARAGPVHGKPAGRTTIREHGLSYLVDIEHGHKTGFYLDQRLNRRMLRAFAGGREVLDCFCYSGGFSLNALTAEAKSVLAIDASAEALALLRENLRLNDLPASKLEIQQGDVFQVLRKYRDAGRVFDLIVLDPPKFAPTSAQLEKAARGYKDINLLAFKLLRPGGILFTFSCSGGVEAGLFQKIVAAAALDAGVDARLIAHLSQDCDHPVALNFPESAYLKGLVCWRA